MRPNGTLLVDTGFWFALFTGHDQRHRVAVAKADIIEKVHLAVPWPTLYETINTKFTKNRVGMTNLDALLNRPTTKLIDDAFYREDALQATIRNRQLPLRSLSLVDMIIRLILNDINVQIDAVATFDERAFFDVCQKRKIEIL